MSNRRDFLTDSGAALAAAALPSGAWAQAFPGRPIKYICPFPAGGSTDVVMRVLAESIGKTLRTTVLVENKAGASGTLGAVELVNAAPDGYTLAQLSINVLRIPHMQKVQFDALKDFTWIIGLTGYTYGLVVLTESPLKTIHDLVTYAKTNPGKFSYASSGTGATSHMLTEEFAMRSGITLLHVPFKGSAEGIQAVLGGHVMAQSDSTSWAPQVDAGRFRLLATYGSKRTKRWPNVPTLQELGYQTASDSPWGVCGPKGMDPSVVKTLHDAFKKTLDDPSVLGAFDKFDQPVTYMNTETYTQFARDTYASEKALVERLGMANKGS